MKDLYKEFDKLVDKYNIWGGDTSDLKIAGIAFIRQREKELLDEILDRFEKKMGDIEGVRGLILEDLLDVIHKLYKELSNE